MILLGDCREVMATLPAESVQCCVTSPPYWGLRDYGVDGQLGLEATPEEYVAGMVEVFREVRRVLRPDGTLWLNLGDSYAGGGRGGNGDGITGRGKNASQLAHRAQGDLRPKDLVGIPWRVAFALQADGWWLRSDIIWHKPNPMPESVTDRPTKAHEYLFLLTKSERYLYNADAIAEPATTGGIPNGAVRSPHGQGFAAGRSGRVQRRRAEEMARQAGLTEEHFAAIRAAGITDAGKALVTQSGTGKNSAEVLRLAAEAREALGGYYREFLIPDTRNARSVWTIPTRPFPEAHFAVFPEEIPRRCILAGSREGDTVLDPFNGAGTTGKVAQEHGRRYVGIELNPEYIEIAERRLAQQTLWQEATG